MLEVAVAIQKHFFMCDELRDLKREDESGRSLNCPTLDSRNRGRAIERGVHFHGIEFRGVVREVVGGFHASPIERTFPACGRERRGPYAD